ncbi:MAG: cob(I)yrinic acid a,c-diamide adenosyltransferase [Candidatus Hydrothermales bacterium]
MRITKVFTGKGDEGFSYYWKDKKKRKDDKIFDALGDLDELNSILGFCYFYSKDDDVKEEVEKIQRLIFIASAQLIIPEEEKGPVIEDKILTELEEKIEKLSKSLGPLKEFIIPSGTLSSLYFHLARTVARRAERSVASLLDEHKSAQVVLKFLNRLSDYLFLLGREVNKREGGIERNLQAFKP